MDPSQNLLPNVQRHNDGIVALLPREEATSVEAQLAGPSHDPDDQHISATKSDLDIDVAVKATHTAPVAQLSDLDSAPLTQTSPAPSAKSFELMSRLEGLARDFAVASRGDSSNQCVGEGQEGSNPFLGLEKVESSIRVSPRPSGLTNYQSESDKASIGGRTAFTLASFFMAALIGVGATIAWQSSHTAEPIGFTPGPSSDRGLQHAAVTRTTTVSKASVKSPELAPQLQAMTQDLMAVRNDVKHLAAEQKHLAAMQQQLGQIAAAQQQLAVMQEQLGQLAAAQQQLAAKQEQMAQNLAKLQAVGQNTRHTRSPARLSRAVPMPPRRNASTSAPPKSSTQASSAPHPRPPVPLPH